MYREAGIYDTVAKKILAPLWKWIAKLGLTKQDVLDFFNGLFDKYLGKKTALNKTVPQLSIPENVTTWIAKALIATGMDRGQFLLALDSALNNPPPGYDWQAVDTLGTQKLVQIGIDALPAEQQFKPAPIISNEKFNDTILIGVWWATENPENTANISLRAYIQSSDVGDIFWEAPNVPPYDTKTQFGGFVIVPRMEAHLVASQLCKLVKDAATAGNEPEEVKKSYKLSSVYLSGLAEGQPITNSDAVDLGCGGSPIKFNWYWNLPDILMGRIQTFRTEGSNAYNKLVAEMKTFTQR